VSADELTAQHRGAVAAADILAGGQRLLDWFPDFKGEKVVLGASVDEAVNQLMARARDASVVVLASGDALFFGIGRLFAERTDPGRLKILPNITAAQAALARLRLPWEKARFFSVHGRDEPLPWRSILLAPLAVVYADAVRTPSEVAAELIRRWPAANGRRAAVVANLGRAEQCVTGTLAEMAKVHTDGLAMLIVCPDNVAMTPPIALGLDDETYDREAGLITHPEIRSVALGKLRLGPGVMWDVGAGSGSVGIEAAGLCEGLIVYAIEKDPARCVQLRNNSAASGCSSVRAVGGVAPDAFASLPAPRSVFVGGGGANVGVIVERAFQRLLPGGSLVAAAVLLETRALLLDCLPEHRADMVEIEVRRARPLGHGHRLEPGNPVALFVYRKEQS
jgi:precorrin-6Y C5,15-methyltransferase (decarboxylating)